MIYPNEGEILSELAAVLERFGIRYAIGGSVASSLYGKMRFTEDIDITVEPFDNCAKEIYENLKTQYYISKESMLQALKSRTSFNIIHFETSLKIDIFVCRNESFEKQLLSRNKMFKLFESIERSLPVVSPEDIVLLKLQWYRDGGCVSEHQWNDITGVLEVQSGKLDYEYLKNWAGTLKIRELLDRAIDSSRKKREL